ncbi:hypothetical protein PILCRDRAFT_72823 [Piloderma croceum F 1598]|uniref:Uncharacterized protein n=1 Tax=Piloderma croceum (strain F 1598) TaxID=765440 RepID=A0A0C3B3V9_PILCF|nr:hypothetical protein PILCRDRAFT_72823 [Piloderma croceum F 1598]
MGGPNLEVFKFGLYLFVPVFTLLHFGDPDWYHNHVLPYQEKLFPPRGKTNQRIPTESSQLREELGRIRAEKLVKRQEREGAETKDTSRLI